jgi:hypothetical protein
MAPKINWAHVRSKMPSTVKTPAAGAARHALFQQFDMNGNGMLSLAEIDKAVRDVLGLDELFDCKPAIMRAYHAAKDESKQAGNSRADDYVERSEFRLLLIYLHLYFNLYEMFQELTPGSTERFNKDEFRRGIPKLKTWGLNVTDVDATFREIDTDKGGVVLFDEFADWAIKKQLKLVEDPFDYATTGAVAQGVVRLKNLPPGAVPTAEGAAPADGAAAPAEGAAQ